MSLKTGDAAPRLSASGHDGRDVDLAALYEAGVVVVFFYPKDETPGCTKEACAFRDVFADFVAAGATVVGVSGDSDKSHRAFAENHRLPYALVADRDRAWREAFGVKKTLGLIEGRKTFVVARGGKVAHMYESQLNATAHVEHALSTVRQLVNDDESARQASLR